MEITSIRISENVLDELTASAEEYAGRLHCILQLSGVLEIKAPRTYYSLYNPSLILIPSAHSIDKLALGADFRGYNITLDRELCEHLHVNMNSMLAWARLEKLQVFSLSRADADSCARYIDILKDAAASSAGAYKDDTFALLVKAFIYKIFGIFEKNLGRTSGRSENNRREQISKSFLKLVEKYGTEHRDLDFYADKLCITPKYLSFVISKATGKKALKWIEEFTISRAIHLLKTTDMSINQIADKLNFSAPSDFCRYFRKSTGTTPRECRKSE